MAIVLQGNGPPAAGETLTEMSDASGATPRTPLPLFAVAAMIPATAVPCGLVASHGSSNPLPSGRGTNDFDISRGEPIRSRNFRARVWRPATEAAGLGGLTVHELRHTCVALLIGRGVGPKQIQAQLGHEDVRTTLQVYGHLFEGHEDVTAAAMDAAIAAASGWDPDGAVVPLAAVRSS